jgi:signal transduction histidine kinase
MGIPADKLEAIFERFVQVDVTKRKAVQGSGLGLSISKAYVDMLGGKIRVTSKMGRGSEFYFTIPLPKN